jgi:hypothetical protein
MNPNESQELAIIQSSVSVLSERFELEQRMAKLFAASGLFTDIKGASQEQAIAQAYVKIALGNSMGFSPAESMQGIDIIQGKPSVGAQLRAARMQRAGYTWTVDQCDWKGCILTFYKGDKKLGVISYLEEDATKAGLIGKDNWKKDAPSMFFARAITRGQRRFSPGVLSLDVMSTEEAIDHTDYTVVPMAEATHGKTEALADKLKAERDKQPKADPVNEATKPEPVKGEHAKSEVIDHDSWAGRCLSFKPKLGEAEFLAVLHATIGSEDVSMVTAENYKPVWAAMEKAVKKTDSGEKKDFF